MKGGGGGYIRYISVLQLNFCLQINVIKFAFRKNYLTKEPVYKKHSGPAHKNHTDESLNTKKVSGKIVFVDFKTA